MKIELTPLALAERMDVVKTSVQSGARLGLISSIDGTQLITLLMNLESGVATCYETAILDRAYTSMTPIIPQAHWFERMTWDAFGLMPEKHPRLKHTHAHDFAPQSKSPVFHTGVNQPDDFLHVEGPGSYEIPVGPIHAGIIEPGHFRFSCYGEVIVNLEIRLGYLHRGIERRIVERAWRQARFLAESAASDMTVANACAHAQAIESLLDLRLPDSSLRLRTTALEVERIAMHIADLGGLAGDIGCLAISSSLSRLRGLALRLGELMSGSRLMRAFIQPGGTRTSPRLETVREMKTTVTQLQNQLGPVIEFFMDNQVVADRMDGIGKISRRMAIDFGLVGIAARSAGIPYDCRDIWPMSSENTLSTAIEKNGDVMARAKLRISEIDASLKLIAKILADTNFDSANRIELPAALPANQASISIIESHRGELIHFLLTDDKGNLRRYCIKDPSVNNWTALAVAIRNNLIADFPLCNKSFGLSYSGHDL